MLSGLVFAGAGGVNNLCQSNWIRDKGFGMGIYIPRIVSPITGEEVAAPATGSMMRQDPENLRRFRGWWAVANREQLVSFWFICVFSITVFSTLAYSTVFGKAIAGQANLAFIRAEGEALKQVVAPWFGTFFWVFGALSMILVALGTIDYIARIVADVLKTVYLQDSQRWTESRVYFLVAWGTIAAGSIILLSGFNQPLLLLVTAACLNGMVMFVYSILLIQLNRRGLPPAIRVSGFRLAMLVFATLFYGFFAGWLVIEQVRGYLAGGIGPAARPGPCCPDPERGNPGAGHRGAALAGKHAEKCVRASRPQVGMVLARHWSSWRPCARTFATPCAAFRRRRCSRPLRC